MKKINTLAELRDEVMARYEKIDEVVEVETIEGDEAAFYAELHGYDGNSETQKVFVGNLFDNLIGGDEDNELINDFVEHNILQHIQPVIFDPNMVFANIRPRAFLEAFEQKNLHDNILFDELPGDVIIFYQHEHPGGLESIEPNKIREIHSCDTIKAKAFANNDQLAEQLEIIYENDFLTVLETSRMPNLSACLLLSKSFRQSIGKKYPKGVYLVIAKTDEVMILDKNDERALPKARNYIGKKFSEDEGNLLSQHIFEWSGKELAIAE